MKDLLMSYLKTPTSETFLKLREAVIEHPDFNPELTGLDDAERLFEQGDFKKVIEKLHSLMPGILLSPRSHMLWCLAADKLELKEEAAIEGHLYHACIDGYLSTGDGSRDKPYMVTSVADEYDILFAQKKELVQQSLRKHKGRYCDVLETKDGSSIWFDVHDIIEMEDQDNLFKGN